MADSLLISKRIKDALVEMLESTVPYDWVLQVDATIFLKLDNRKSHWVVELHDNLKRTKPVNPPVLESSNHHATTITSVSDQQSTGHISSHHAEDTSQQIPHPQNVHHHLHPPDACNIGLPSTANGGPGTSMENRSYTPHTEHSVGPDNTEMTFPCPTVHISQPADNSGVVSSTSSPMTPISHEALNVSESTTPYLGHTTTNTPITDNQSTDQMSRIDTMHLHTGAALHQMPSFQNILSGFGQDAYNTGFLSTLWQGTPMETPRNTPQVQRSEPVVKSEVAFPPFPTRVYPSLSDAAISSASSQVTPVMSHVMDFPTSTVTHPSYVPNVTQGTAPSLEQSRNDAMSHPVGAAFHQIPSFHYIPPQAPPEGAHNNGFPSTVHWRGAAMENRVCTPLMDYSVNQRAMASAARSGQTKADFGFLPVSETLDAPPTSSQVTPITDTSGLLHFQYPVDESNVSNVTETTTGSIASQTEIRSDNSGEQAKSRDLAQREQNASETYPTGGTPVEATRESDHAASSVLPTLEEAGPQTSACDVSEKSNKREKRFCCEFCGKLVRDRRLLGNHQRVHNGEKPYKCNFCGLQFSLSSNLKRHLRIHTGERPYACKLCDRRFVQHGNLQKHYEAHFGKKPYQCSVCDVTFSDGFKLVEHQQLNHKEEDKPFVCYCGQRFWTKRLLIIHSRRNHNDNKIGPSGGGICRFCGKTFSCLKAHRRTHTGEKPYKCVTCGTSFSSDTNRQRHSRIHTDERPFPCKYCDKRFRQGDGLKTHERIHTGEKPHKCNLCDARFSDASTLYKHKKRHSISYKCDLCRLSFQHKLKLVSHLKTHLF